MKHTWQIPLLVLLTLAILGTSSASASPWLVITPNDSLDFGTTTLGTPITRTIILSNVGTSDLFISGVATGGEFTVISSPHPLLAIPFGASASVKLRMDATSLGPQTGLVEVSSNDPFLQSLDLEGIVESATTNPQVFMVAPNADSFVRQEQGANNFGSEDILRVRGGDSGLARYSFLRFNLPSFTGSVQSAVLRIRPKIKTITSARVYDVNIGWGENTITWNNWQNGGTTFSYLRDTGSLAAEQWHEIDVHEAIPAGGGTVNIGLATLVDDFGFRFYSRESAFVPTLEVTVQ